MWSVYDVVLVYGLFVNLCVPQGVGGEYPASSTSASEAANEKILKQRGPGTCSVNRSSCAVTHGYGLMQCSSWSQTSCSAYVPSADVGFVMLRLLTDRLVWRPPGCVRVPHCTLSGRRKPLSHRLARMLRDRCHSAAYSVLLPYADAHDDAVSGLQPV